MAIKGLLLRQAVASGSGLVYWGGVLIQARRVRRQIGRSPNLRPRGPKEKLLWAGWFLVIAGWLIQPMLVGNAQAMGLLALNPALLHPLGLAAGLALIAAGYAGTLWCYAVMGSAWRIGINRLDQGKLVTHGPFRRVRHPIYLFQIVMLIGICLLLPTALSLVILAIHFVCVVVKSGDEEAHLENVFGAAYRDYKTRSGRLFPKMKS
jgi:protein-S-isoprenylcysteine O-methyltransferase Ste14